jgi:hypothetical protein
MVNYCTEFVLYMDDSAEWLGGVAVAVSLSGGPGNFEELVKSLVLLLLAHATRSDEKYR